MKHRERRDEVMFLQLRKAPKPILWFLAIRIHIGNKRQSLIQLRKIFVNYRGCRGKYLTFLLFKNDDILFQLVPLPQVFP
jgi:hypothetical protein